MGSHAASLVIRPVRACWHPLICVRALPHVQLGVVTWLLALVTIELALPHKAVYKVRVNLASASMPCAMLPPHANIQKGLHVGLRDAGTWGAHPFIRHVPSPCSGPKTCPHPHLPLSAAAPDPRVAGRRGLDRWPYAVPAGQGRGEGKGRGRPHRQECVIATSHPDLASVQPGCTRRPCCKAAALMALLWRLPCRGLLVYVAQLEG